MKITAITVLAGDSKYYGDNRNGMDKVDKEDREDEENDVRYSECNYEHYTM